MSEVVGVAPPGSVLADARQAKGLSVRDVASAMNMMPFQIEALEANDFAKFNSELFVKGYIRRYADLLGLSAEPLLADTNKLLANGAKAKKRDSEDRNPRAKAKATVRNNKLRQALVFAGAILIWILANSLLSGPEEALTDAVEAHSIVIINDFVPGGADDSHWVSVEVDIFLSFEEDASVLLRDSRGEVLVSGMQERGSSLQLQGLAPFDVILSYWPAVKMRYRDKDIDLAQVLTYSFDVARLRIGEK